MRRKQRLVHPALIEYESSKPRSSQQDAAYARLPARLRQTLAWSHFTPAYYRRKMAIDAEFLASLTKKSRVLDIGAGTGRLADHVVRNSSLRQAPHNYVMVDKAYEKSGVELKANIRRLVRQGKMQLHAVNYWTDKLPPGKYDHIIFSESFFSPIISTESARYDSNMGLLVALKKVWPKLKIGGTLRIAPVYLEFLEKGNTDLTKGKIPPFRYTHSDIIMSLLARLCKEHLQSVEVVGYASGSGADAVVLRKHGPLPRQIYRHPAAKAIEQKVMAAAQAAELKK